MHSLTTRRVFAAGAAALLAAGPARAVPRDIHVRMVGTGDRVWVLLHPFSASGKFWEARAAALAEKHGVTVVSPDLPSHGRSRIIQRFGYGDATRAIAEALAGFTSPEVIVGASSGGIVALRLAALQQRPVVAIGVGDAFSPANVAAMKAQAAQLDAGAEQFVAAFLEQGEPQRQAIRRHYGDLAARGSTPFLGASERARLAGRTVIINGERDSFFTHASARALAGGIAGATLSFVPGAEHLEPLAAANRDFTWSAVEALTARHRR